MGRVLQSFTTHDWWTDPLVAQVLSASAWTSTATALSVGDAPVFGPTVVNGKVVTVAGNGGLCGLCLDLPDGDFRRLLRVGFSRGNTDPSTASYCLVAAGYQEGTGATGLWRGYGIATDNNGWGAYVGRHVSDNGAAGGWASYTAGTASGAGWRDSFVVGVERSGTTLRIYPGHADGLLQQMNSSSSVSATGGRLFVRIQAEKPDDRANSGHTLRVDISAYGIYSTSAAWPP